MAAAIELHRVCWNDPGNGRMQQFFTTVNKAMRFARRERISDEAHFDVVEIPRTKLGMAEWLNANFSTDNG